MNLSNPFLFLFRPVDIGGCCFRAAEQLRNDGGHSKFNRLRVTRKVHFVFYTDCSTDRGEHESWIRGSLGF